MNLSAEILNVANREIYRRTLSPVCPHDFEITCKEQGWIFDLDNDYNGWEVDWWATITIEDKVVYVNGSMYYGEALIRWEK